MSPNKSEPDPPPGFSGLWPRFLADGSCLELECVDGKPNGRVRVRYLAAAPSREVDVVPWRTTRRLMVVVAVTALTLAWARHARWLLSAEPEYGGPLLFVECLVAVLVVLPAALTIRFAVRLARREQAHLRRLRRNATPARCLWPAASPPPSEE